MAESLWKVDNALLIFAERKERGRDGKRIREHGSELILRSTRAFAGGAKVSGILSASSPVSYSLR